MEVKVIFIILGVLYWVLKSYFGANNDDAPKNNKRPHSPQQSRPQKSFEEILNDMMNTAEQKTKAKPQVVPKRQELDWQEVRRSKIVQKKQLIKHEDYHPEHGSAKYSAHPIEVIADTEGTVYHFDKEDIDWKRAVILKEILDRKYA